MWLGHAMAVTHSTYLASGLATGFQVSNYHYSTCLGASDHALLRSIRLAHAAKLLDLIFFVSGPSRSFASLVIAVSC